jgi:hypothetical protein
MEKHFDRWSRHKRTLHALGERPFYHAREIWWCAVGVNIGNELNGTGKEHDRPVLVIQPFNAETFFGIASLPIRAAAASTFRSAKLKSVKPSRIFHQCGRSIPSASSARSGRLTNARSANWRRSSPSHCFRFYPSNNLPRVSGARPKPYVHRSIRAIA